jgi:phage terminase large subunit-like protein
MATTTARRRRRPRGVAELDRFRRFVATLALEDGRRMRLLAFQRQMLAEHFAGATETLLLLPKKNAKTTTLAALALHHLVTTPDCEVIVVAASRDQATILYDQAGGFVRRTPELWPLVDVKRGYRELRAREHFGRVRVLAADVDTADGPIPTLVLVDELHRHRSIELYAILRDGLGPRRGRMITISTAGKSATSPLALMRRAAYQLPIQDRDGAHRRAMSADGSYVMHEWALDPGADVDDMTIVKGCNPAPWHTPTRLQARHDSPSMTPWDWRRFACNIWQATAEPWLPAGAWDALARSGLVLKARSPAWLGVFRLRESGAAVVAVSADPKRRDGWACSARILRNDRRQVDLAEIEDAVRLAALRFDVQAVVYDPLQFDRSAEQLADEGLVMIEFPQTNARMAPASDGLYQAIVGGELVHDGDVELAVQVEAGVTTQTERGWRLTVRGAPGPVEALIALAMAYHAASRGFGAPRQYRAMAV